MKNARSWNVLFCLVLALAPAPRPLTAGEGARSHAAKKASLCDLLAHPEAFSGEVVVVTVRISSFKEGALLWSPKCPKRGIGLWIKTDSGPGIPELRRALTERPVYGHPLIVTLEGTLDRNHYDEVLGRKREVFEVIAAREIHRSPKKELLH